MKKLDILAEIRRAKADPALAVEAAEWAAIAIQASLQKDHARQPGMLRASDAGSCVRAVWADIHGKLDIDEDTDAQLLRMDPGTLMGAHYAALLKVAIESGTREHGMTVELEVPATGDGITGHADAVIYEAGDFDGREYNMVPVAVVEFKLTFGFVAPIAPHEAFKNGSTRLYHVHQAIRYAMSLGAQIVSVVTVNPSKGMREDVYAVGTWKFDVASEFTRLSKAKDDEMPDPDVKPTESWRCASCRFSACAKNANVQREVA